MKFRPWKAAHNVWKYIPHALIFGIVLSVFSGVAVGTGGLWWYVPAGAAIVALIAGTIFGAVILWHVVNDLLSRKKSQEYAKELVQ